MHAARGDKIDGLREKIKDWEEKVLHGQYLKQTKEVRSDQRWAWLQDGDLKR